MPALPSRAEFVAIVAMVSALIAFSIDAMLPAMPALEQQFSPHAPNNAHLVVPSFVLGMGLGTLFTGPLSDALGRKRVVLGGMALYILGALLAIWAQDLTMLLAARVLQGLGAAGPRIVALAVVRDLYAGRVMAQIMSFIMIVFSIVPALAPWLGDLMIRFGGWQAVFVGFVLFAVISGGLFALRLPETLPPEKRRPFQLSRLWRATQDMLQLRMVRISILVQSLCYAMLFATITSIQPIYDDVFGRAESFPLWFGGIALLSSSAGVLNAMLVRRLGMRLLVTAMMMAQVVVSLTMLALLLGGLSGDPLFWAFAFWQFVMFFQAGIVLGNLNALAMEPLGHIGGLAASVINFLSTLGAVGLTVLLSLSYDGSPVPLTLGCLIMAVLALGLMLRLGARGAEDPVQT
jgi:DHA1 family bicyclomycin/chloramphenicol resistance-like MFS transporter